MKSIKSAPGILLTRGKAGGGFAVRRATLALLAALAALALSPCAVLAASDEVEELNFYNTDLHLVLKSLAEKTGYPFVEDVPVEGKVTIHVSKKTPIAEVLDQMLRGLNLSWKLERGVYHVGLKMPVKGLPLGKGLLAKTYPLNFMDADEAASILRSLLSEYGKVTVDQWMNTVTVTDIGEIHESVKGMLDGMDMEGRRPAQINIQVKVLQIDRSDGTTQDATVSWSKYNAFESVGSYFANQLDWQRTSEYNSFYPGAFTFKVGYWGMDQFVARYMAYLDVSRVNILSEPDLTVPNDKEATINVGDRIAVLRTGSNYSYQDVGIYLKVKPKLGAEGRIELDINPQITDLGATPGFNNFNCIDYREVKTKVEVISGGTVRIGGLVFTEEQEHERRIPILGDLPLLGNLFKYRATTKFKREVVILVSPRLLESIPPRCAATAGISALTGSLIAGTTNVMLDWSEDVPFDNVGVVRFNVYRDIRPVVGIAGMLPLTRDVRGDLTSWVDLTPKRRGVTYYYAVTAVDGAGNEQAASNSPSVTIPRR